MVISKRLRFFLNYFIGPVLFAILAYSIYRQINNQHDWHQKWDAIQVSLSGTRAWRFYTVIFLMLVNWGIESKKWQILLKHTRQMNFTQAYKSVLSGVAFTMLTPNRMGEFIGRLFYVEEGQRIRAATLTIIGSMSQLIITFLTGLTGLVVLKLTAANFSFFWVNGLMGGGTIIFVLMVLVYFKISWLIRWIEKKRIMNRYVYFLSVLDNFKTIELLQILLLSLLRFSVFTLQYILLFYLFDVNISWWQGWSAISVLFLMLAVVPTITLAELGIRGEFSLLVIGLFSTNVFGILMTTASIWLINIIFPAVLGTLLVLNVKLFKKNSEST